MLSPVQQCGIADGGAGDEPVHKHLRPLHSQWCRPQAGRAICSRCLQHDKTLGELAHLLGGGALRPRAAPHAKALQGNMGTSDRHASANQEPHKRQAQKQSCIPKNNPASCGVQRSATLLAAKAHTTDNLRTRLCNGTVGPAAAALWTVMPLILLCFWRLHHHLLDVSSHQTSTAGSRPAHKSTDSGAH